MAGPDTAPEAGAAEAPGAPPLGEAARQLHAAGRESLDSMRDMRRAFARLVSADIALARIALGRAAVWMGMAVAFGSSAWLLLMAALISALHAAGLSWLAATAISALVSLAIAGVAGWRALHFFQMGRFEATRRQLARLSRKDDEDEDPAVRPVDLDQVQRRIERADQVLSGRSVQLKANLRQMRGTWKAAWTPWRILGAGLGLGFASGKLDPEKAASGMAARLGAAPKVLQMLTALSGLLAATRAQAASENAEAAAEAAGQVEGSVPDLAVAAAAAAGVATAAPAEGVPRQPPPAEAATDMDQGSDGR